MSHSHKCERRGFLRLSARLAALGLTSLGAGATRTFFEREVHASTVSDYKALVCIYLFGGNDSNNMIVPVDTSRYTAYQSSRGGLVRSGGGLTAQIADSQQRPYAFHSSAASLLPHFNSGDLAVVLNMGPLLQPLTKQQFQAGATRPDNLYSHSDQTIQVQAGNSRLDGSGWGGRLLDCFSISDNLAAVSVSSPATFLDGTNVRGNVVPPGARLQLSGMSTARRTAVEAMLRLDQGNPLRAAANRSFGDGLLLGDRLSASERLPALATTFPGTSLGTQMAEVMRLIRLRSVQGPGRQVFFTSLGGWDTHASQDGSHASLLQQLTQAMTAFYNATAEIGLADRVTTFTQSEFNRTMQTNGSGTDHAWGGHNLVLGAGVRGGIYGDLPTFALGGPDDTGTRGVWIPTISTAQYGATLGGWFGASASELLWAFPHLSAFGTRNLGFMA